MAPRHMGALQLCTYIYMHIYTYPYTYIFMFIFSYTYSCKIGCENMEPAVAPRHMGALQLARCVSRCHYGPRVDSIQRHECSAALLQGMTRVLQRVAGCCSVLQRVAVSKDMNVLLRYYKE